MPVGSPSGSPGSSTQSHPPGCYWVNVSTGTIQRQCNELLAVALGQVGFTGQGGGDAGIAQPFETFEAAKQFVDQYRGSTIGGQLAQHNLAPHIGNPLTGINAIGDFFSRLEDPHTWVRVGEFLAGGILLWIGLNALTRGQTRDDVTRPVKKAARATRDVVAPKTPPIHRRETTIIHKRVP
jgi:hypothetical protein